MKIPDNIKYFPTRFWHRTWFLRHSPKHAYWHLTKGFCYCETWGLDRKIAEYALPRLKYLRDHNSGVPCDMYENQERLQTNNATAEDDEKANLKWQQTLDEIIFALEWIVEGDWKTAGIDTGKTEKCDNQDDMDSLFYPLGEKPIYDWKKMDEVEKRVQNGLQLLSTHFRSLWD